MKGNVINLNTLHLNSVRLNGIGKVQSVSLKGGSTEDPVFPPVEPPIEPEPTPTYTLSASVTNGKVSATRNGSAVNLPYTANEGDVIVLEVTPNDGYAFEGWADGVTDNPRTITMTADVVLSAQCVEVVQPPVGNYIQFEDKAVEAICVANWSSDGIGLTEEDAAAVASIGTTFKGNTEITSFDEFVYFTGIDLVGSYGWGNNSGFSGCTNLRSIKLPPSATALCNGCFYNCTSLEDIGDTSNITSIGHASFGGSVFRLSGIKTANFPRLDFIGGMSNWRESKIEEVISLGTITTIPSQSSSFEGAFYKCINLKKVNLPSSFTNIQPSTFLDCSALEFINIPEGITTIGNDAFCGCSSMRLNIKLPNLSTLGTTSSASCFRKSGILSIDLTGSSIETIFSTGSSVKGMFAGCTNLSRVILNEGLKTIQNYAFGECSSLTEVYFPNSLEEIGEFAFYNTSLANQDIRIQGLKITGKAAFKGTKMRSVELPSLQTMNGTSSSAYGTFNGCTNLEYVLVGSSLTSMGGAEFSNNPKLKAFICHATSAPTMTGESFENTPIKSGEGYIYVPDQSVEVYKTGTNWKTYASQIKGISEYNG